MTTYAAIKEIGLNKYIIVVMWGVGPVYLDGQYSSRSKARYALNKIVGKNRKLVSFNRLYEIHEQKIHEMFEASREPTKEDKRVANKDSIVSVVEPDPYYVHNVFTRAHLGAEW